MRTSIVALATVAAVLVLGAAPTSAQCPAVLNVNGGTVDTSTLAAATLNLQELLPISGGWSPSTFSNWNLNLCNATAQCAGSSTASYVSHASNANATDCTGAPFTTMAGAPTVSGDTVTFTYTAGAASTDTVVVKVACGGQTPALNGQSFTTVTSNGTTTYTLSLESTSVCAQEAQCAALTLNGTVIDLATVSSTTISNLPLNGASSVVADVLYGPCTTRAACNGRISAAYLTVTDASVSDCGVAYFNTLLSGPTALGGSGATMELQYMGYQGSTVAYATVRLWCGAKLALSAVPGAAQYSFDGTRYTFDFQTSAACADNTPTVGPMTPAPAPPVPTAPTPVPTIAPALCEPVVTDADGVIRLASLDAALFTGVRQLRADGTATGATFDWQFSLCAAVPQCSGQGYPGNYFLTQLEAGNTTCSRALFSQMQHGPRLQEDGSVLLRYADESSVRLASVVVRCGTSPLLTVVNNSFTAETDTQSVTTFSFELQTSAACAQYGAGSSTAASEGPRIITELNAFFIGLGACVFGVALGFLVRHLMTPAARGASEAADAEMKLDAGSPFIQP